MGVTAALSLVVGTCDGPQPPNFDSYTFQTESARGVEKDGIWLRDQDGRYIILRGVNFSSRSKLPPYIPVMPLGVRNLNPSAFYSELKDVQPDLARLRSLGMNVIRLPIIWKGIEPRPNPNLEQLLPEGIRYLTVIKRIVDELYEHYGLWVILDFHQDIAHEFYNGDGFPDWALAIDSTHERPSPGDLQDSKWGLHYYNTVFTARDVLVRNTLHSFWANNLTNTDLGLVNFPVRTHLEETIGRTAEFFRDNPAVLGYEPFNEPHPVGFAKHEFEEEILPDFYQRAFAAISQFDDDALLFIEPRMDWTTYAANGPEFGALDFTLHPETFLDTALLSQAHDRLVFSFHYYDPYMVTGFPFVRNIHDKVDEWPGVFELLRQAATSRDLVPFLTEFGCSQNWTEHTDWRPEVSHEQVVRACMELQYKEVEDKLLNSTYWDYDLYTREHVVAMVDGSVVRWTDENWNLENFSILGANRSPANTDIVARCYPMRSSAQPLVVSFDSANAHCSIVLQGSAVAAPTVIFVPFSAHYSDSGFEVRSTSEEVRWDEGRGLLYWIPDPDLDRNLIILSPEGEFTPSALPIESKQLLAETKAVGVFGG